MKKTLWKVAKAVLGAERPAELYFETKEAADKFYNDSDYADKPVKVTMSEDEAWHALASTEFYFEQ